MGNVKIDYLDYIRELEDQLKERKITQSDLGNLLGLTRQSISNIYKGKYVQLNSITKDKICRLINSDIDKIEAIIKMGNQIEYVKEQCFNMDIENVEYYTNILKYINYWIDTPNLGEKYMKHLSIQMENFHLKLNPYHLFFNVYFDKDSNPLLTFDIDYEKNIIRKMHISNTIDNISRNPKIDPNYSEKWLDFYKTQNLTFEQFVEWLVKFSNDELAYNIYIDHLDNQLDYVRDNVKSSTRKLMEKIRYYDISKLFATEEQYFSVEDVLANYLTDVNKDKVLVDAQYRNEMLTEVINIITGNNLKPEDKLLSFMKISDSEKYSKSNAITKQVKERRSLKMKK